MPMMVADAHETASDSMSPGSSTMDAAATPDDHFGAEIAGSVADCATTERTVGRRERKKQATREALIEAALQLFGERGFDNVTVDDIADAVDVSARTFHRHFPRKEDVIFADGDQRLADLRAELASRPANESVLDSLRATLHDQICHIPDLELERTRVRLFASTDRLRADNLHRLDARARAIAEEAARRSGQQLADAWPSLIGATAHAAISSAWRRWAHDPAADIHHVIDETFDLLANLEAADPTRAGEAR